MAPIATIAVLVTISILFDMIKAASLPSFDNMTPGESFGATLWLMIFVLKPVIIGTIYAYEKYEKPYEDVGGAAYAAGGGGRGGDAYAADSAGKARREGIVKQWAAGLGRRRWRNMATSGADETDDGDGRSTQTPPSRTPPRLTRQP